MRGSDSFPATLSRAGRIRIKLRTSTRDGVVPSFDWRQLAATPGTRDPVPQPHTMNTLRREAKRGRRNISLDRGIRRAALSRGYRTRFTLSTNCELMLAGSEQSHGANGAAGNLFSNGARLSGTPADPDNAAQECDAFGCDRHRFVGRVVAPQDQRAVGPALHAFYRQVAAVAQHV